MDAEPPLEYLLDSTTGAGGAPPGRDELLAIVARSRSQRRRVLALGLAGTLVVGAAVGWVLGAARSTQSSRGTSLAAGSPNTTTTAPGATAPLALAGGGSAYSYAPGQFNLTKLFVRTTGDGVTVRVYQPPAIPAASLLGCPSPVAALEIEVSTAAVAGQVFGLSPPEAGTPFKALSEDVIGIPEGAPVWVMAAQTDSTVAQVRAVFSDGGVDQMAPVAGFVALAHVAKPGSVDAANPYPAGTLEALDANGKVIGKATMPVPPPLVPPKATTVAPAQPGVAVPDQSSPPTTSVGPVFPAPGSPAIEPPQPVSPRTTVPGAPPANRPPLPPSMACSSPSNASSGSSGSATASSSGSASIGPATAGPATTATAGIK